LDALPDIISYLYTLFLFHAKTFSKDSKINRVNELTVKLDRSRRGEKLNRGNRGTWGFDRNGNGWVLSLLSLMVRDVYEKRGSIIVKLPV